MEADQVAALLRGEGAARQVVRHGASEGEARQARAELLAPVLESCKDAWEAGSEKLDFLAEKLGDGSRDESWRLPYADSGILDFFLKVLSTEDIRSRLVIQSLRIVGNCCADTDENRAKLVEEDRLAVLFPYLENMDLVMIATTVLFNTLVDYEPAQQLAAKLKLSQRFTKILQLPSIASHTRLLPYVAQILGLLVPHESEETLSDPEIPLLLLRLIERPVSQENIDDFANMATAAAAYLANDKVQQALTKDESRSDDVWSIFDLYSQSVTAAHVEDDDSGDDQDEDVARQLKALQIALLTVLVDITAQDSFTKLFPMAPGSKIWGILQGWLKSPHAQLKAASFLAMGNVSRSDETALALVQEMQVHQDIATVVSDSSIKDLQLLHAALSFAKNLAIPQQSRPLLGEHLLVPEAVPRLLALETWPQVQFAAVSLARLLLVNCEVNVRRVCSPLVGKAEGTTVMEAILTAFRKSDAEPTKMEAARSVLTTCRTLHSQPESEVGNFYQDHDCSDALAFLITQQKWPTLKSEAWFVFALMCRSQEGSTQVLKLLEKPQAADALTETITGRKSGEMAVHSEEDDQGPLLPDGLSLEPQQVDPSQQADMKVRDRENALVMCTEMLQSGALKEGEGEGEWEGKKEWLQGLMREGTALVVSDRAKA